MKFVWIYTFKAGPEGCGSATSSPQDHAQSTDHSHALAANPEQLKRPADCVPLQC